MNIREALELFFETASPAEIQARLHEEVYVTQKEKEYVYSWRKSQVH